MSGLYYEELPRKNKMIEQWLLYTNWGRTQIWGLPISITASDALLRGVEMNISASRSKFEVIIFIKPYKHFISFHMSFWASSKLILTFSK